MKESIVMGSRRAVVLVLMLAACTIGCASTILLQPQFTRRGQGTPAEADRIALTNARGSEIGAFLNAVDGDYGTVMVSGGNAMSKGQTYRYTGFLHGHGFRSMTFSFEGYDSNAGEADLGSMLGDARVVYEYLSTRFPGEPVAYLASSISTAPGLCLPSYAPELAGVILEGAINLRTLPFQKMLQWWPALPLFPLTLPFASVVSASIPGELSAGRCAESAGDVPALFLHHPKDIMTSYGSARGLYEKYAGPKQFVVLESRNRQYHLLLSRDRDARVKVLKALHGWLRPPG
jgi:fermentation-respiration switch protein FrsA (DUF1100 family)